MSDVDVFAFLHSVLFADDGQTADQMRRDWEEFGRFSFLTNVGEQFDGWQTFVFSRDTKTITILARGGDELPSAFQVEALEFIEVVRQFRSWFDGQVEFAA